KTTAEHPTGGGASVGLWMSTGAFTVCFAAWTSFAIIGLHVKTELGLSETAFGLLVGAPVLTGALARVPFGLWADRIGGRRVLVVAMLLAALATFLTSFADSYPEFLIAALGVGLAGGSFPAGVAYIARSGIRERWPSALGVFGTGNVG